MEKLKCFFPGVIIAMLVVLVILLWAGEAEQGEVERYAITASANSLWILDTKTGIAKSFSIATGHPGITIGYSGEK